MTDAPEIVIAQAQRADAPKIAGFLHEWLEVSGIAWPKPEPNAMVEWVLHTIDVGYVVQANGSGRILGAAGIQPCYLPWNISEPIYRDAFFHVARSRTTSPHHENQARAHHAMLRAHDVANGLLDALKIHCAGLGKPLMLEILTGAGVGSVIEWLGIKGGRYVGGVMLFGMEG